MEIYNSYYFSNIMTAGWKLATGIRIRAYWICMGWSMDNMDRILDHKFQSCEPVAFGDALLLSGSRLWHEAKTPTISIDEIRQRTVTCSERMLPFSTAYNHKVRDYGSMLLSCLHFSRISRRLNRVSPAPGTGCTRSNAFDTYLCC